MTKLRSWLSLLGLTAVLATVTACSGATTIVEVPRTQTPIVLSLPTPNLNAISLNQNSLAISLSWTVPSGTFSPIQGYRVYIKYPGNALFQETALASLSNATSYTHTDPLVRGFGTYDFRIQPVSTQGKTGPMSNSQSIAYRGYKNWSQNLSTFTTQGAVKNTFTSPYAVAVNANNGRIYVADTNNHRILEFDSSGSFLQAIGSQGSGTQQFNGPRGVAVDSSGLVYVADSENDRIVRFNPSSFSGTFTALGRVVAGQPVSGTGTGEFNHPVSIAVDSDGKIFVAEDNGYRIQSFNMNSGGAISNAIAFGNSSTFTSISHIALGSSNLFVVDKSQNRVHKLSKTGAAVNTWGTTGTGNGQFREPLGIAVDTNTNDVYISDSKNDRIQVFDSNGTFKATWGTTGTQNGQHSKPAGMAYVGGKLFVVEIKNNRLQIFQ